jgi:hypothetical protein
MVYWVYTLIRMGIDNSYTRLHPSEEENNPSQIKCINGPLVIVVILSLWYCTIRSTFFGVCEYLIYLHFSPVSNDVFSEEEINFATSGVLDRHRHAATKELCRVGIPKNNPQTMPQSTTVTIINVLP